MKTQWLNRPFHLALCLLAALSAGAAAQALTLEETSSVLFMKQEEKLARDVYQALATRWDHPAFRNITVSEQRHMEALDRLIAQHGLSDPTPTAPGKFTIPELQTLHDALLTRGTQSLAEALRVGILVEQTDISDLKQSLLAVAEPTLQRVFSNLLRASGQHLQSFTSSLAQLEGTETDVSTPCAAKGSPTGICPASGQTRARGNRGASCRQATTCPSAATCATCATCPTPESCSTESCPQAGSGACKATSTDKGNAAGYRTPARRGRN